MRAIVTLSSALPLSSFFKRRIRKAVNHTLQGLPKSATKPFHHREMRFVISVAVVGIQTMKKLNSKYRGKDRPTDVLSFSRLESPFPHALEREIGDLVICLPVAKRQAREFQEPLGRELERLAVHGTLHLFGYDHEKSQRDEKIMFGLQDKLLKGLSSKHLKT